MDYEKIFYQYEEQYIDRNNQRIKEFVYLFLKESGIREKEVKAIYDCRENDFMDFYDSLKKVVYRFYPKLIPFFEDLLKQSGFNTIYAIQEAMFYLGSTTNKNLNKEWKNLLMLSPSIKNIEYYHGKIIVSSENFGKHSFYSIQDYFREDFLAKQFIRKMRYEDNCKDGGICHIASWDFMDLLDNASLVTELLPCCYDGTYYHSIIRNEEGMFIDLANEVVYDEKTRKEFYQGQIVCETRKEDLVSHLDEAIVASMNPNIEEEFGNSLLLTLHKQAKMLNGKE